MLITSESLGVWNPGISIFKACVVQPKLRNSVFEVQTDLALPLMGSWTLNKLPKLYESQVSSSLKEFV